MDREAHQATNGYEGNVGYPVASPKLGKHRSSRARKKHLRRVSWDEQAIAEHDKERGTRQKIDEADTPFVRSPQTASDSEGGLGTSDDERHRLQHRQQAVRFFPEEQAGQQPVVAAAVAVAAASSSCIDTSRPTLGPHRDRDAADVDPHSLASRLHDWVISGGNQRRASAGSSSVGSSDGLEYHGDAEFSSASSSRASSSAPHRRPTDDSHDGSKRAREARKRISLPEDSQPKPTSDHFKAKRAQHYNEWVALKSFNKPGSNGETSTDTDTSTEEEEEWKHDSVTKTNTNTNINRTISKDHSDRCRRPRGSGASASSLDLADSAEAQPSSRRSLQSGARDRAVSFSGESGGESNEEFRRNRRRHHSSEYRRAAEDRTLRASMGSLETNTNTNLNAGSGASSSDGGSSARSKMMGNPMEAGKPPVRIAVDDVTDSQTAREGPSQEFRGRRRQHYDEVAALRRFRSESRDEDDEESSANEVDGTLSPNLSPTLSPTADSGPQIATEVQHGNPANPMEPRDAGVAFKFTSPAVSPKRRTAPSSSSGEGTSVAAWRAKRAAHYNEMAMALRLMPPASSDEESNEEEGTTGRR